MTKLEEKFIKQGIEDREWSLLQCRFNIAYYSREQTKKLHGEDTCTRLLGEQHKQISMLEDEIAFLKSRK